MFRHALHDGAYLALLEERHAEEVFEVVDRYRDDLREWLPWVDKSREPEATRAFIEQSLDQFAKNLGFSAGIWCNGDYAGTIGCHKIEWPNRNVEIGYWLSPAYRGRGLATAAARLFTQHAFAEWDLHRVQIRCAEGNSRSRAIPERLGFELEGTLREAELVNDRYYNLCIYGMLARNWKAL